MDWNWNITAVLKEFLYDEKHPLLFNSGFFVYFFTAFIALYYSFRNNLKVRAWLFCFFSLYFFYKASGFFVIMVLLSAVVDYFIANLMQDLNTKNSRKILLWTGILFNVIVLCYFKYTNFFLQTINDIQHKQYHPLNIILPVGISFYTFESISYMVDVYKRKMQPAKHFRDYLLFLSFFPKLVMGPIVRAADFLPQINKPYFVSQSDFSTGFYLILTGLFKKLVISDYISSNFTSIIFDNPAHYSGLECLFATYGFAIVIYCDFSGYSDIAIGIAKWLGYSIPTNFNTPYQSIDITEFWKRWHISLSSWLKDYIYIPLGGNRKGVFLKYIFLIATMLIGGLWHGANFTFIIWGGMHGLALVVHKLWQEKSRTVLQNVSNTKWYKILSVFITFQFVCLAWVFFKSENVTDAITMFRQIKYHLNWTDWAPFWKNYHNVILMILAGYILHILPEIFSNKVIHLFRAEGIFGYLFAFIIFLIAYAFFKSSETIMPIYLQF